MSVVQQLSVDELGQYLMSLTIPEPPKEQLPAEIGRLVRNQGKNLRQTMSQLKAYCSNRIQLRVPSSLCRGNVYS
jgi:hypothetical protein